MVQHWAQSILGYTFAVVHRPNRMMFDVDVFYRHDGKLIVAQLCNSNIIHGCDKRHQLQAYQQDDFISSSK